MRVGQFNILVIIIDYNWIKFGKKGFEKTYSGLARLSEKYPVAAVVKIG